MRYLCLVVIILSSCTVPDKASLKVSRETRKLEKSPVVLRAGNQGRVTDDELVFRENNSFTYRSRTVGGQKVVIYAGTFVRNGDSLLLHFHNDHKDEFWTGNAVIDQTANSITLLSSDTSLNKRLAIMGSKK